MFAAFAGGFRGISVNFSGGGEPCHIMLSDDLVISFDGDEMLAQSSNVDLRFSLDEVSGWNYIEPLSVGAPGIDTVSVNRDGRVVTLAPVKSGVNVYTLSGRAVMSVGTADGVAVADLSELGAGGYILCVDGVSIKMILR